jgi:peptidoglycan/LPS O-acetylase OafA/YrhL
LDPVRAVAITGVVGAHVGGAALHAHGIDGLPFLLILEGGHGVDLFFALSGFLIGGLLLDILERGAGARAWLVFLVRRWLRTLPVYAVWLVVLLICVPPASPLGHAVRYLSLTQNLAWPMPADGWFGISWSLTIEEWFYVSFSGLLLALHAITRKSAVLVTCVLFLIIPLLARLAFSTAVVDWDSGMRKVAALRLDAIAYGVAMAWLCRYGAITMTRWRRWMFAAGLGIFVLAETGGFASIMGQRWHALYFSLLPLAGALVMPMAVGLRIPWGAARAAIHWLSERSYALYLVHLTFLDVATRELAAGRLPRGWLAPTVLVASAAVAELSFRWLESPILSRRPDQFEVGGTDATGAGFANRARARF